ncbi:short-chain dehydrogenase/reductase family protein [Favolaschia claudopus]|uniref:Short-chain dehydrogenase/reductase family protein n=1 Tax=Favolaschia claudopus TaxID=2862362 RepID=A0AAV9ZEX6_9AGAR
MSPPSQIFTPQSTAEEVASVFSEAIQGKNVLITGTSLNGIGFETARAIARHANLVVITGYSAERLKLSENGIKKSVPTANIRRLTLDLSSLDGVRKAAAEVNAYPEPIHVLIHNAAAAIGPFKLTVDNLESQMATDHIGPFLLTKLLLNKLRSLDSPSFTPRVIFVSGAAHAYSPGISLPRITSPSAEGYTNFGAYWDAKCANILTASELARRGRGVISAFSIHPGFIFSNFVQKDGAVPELQASGILTADGLPNTEKYAWKTIEQGAATSVAAAFDPSISDKSGSYLVDGKISNESIAPHAADPETAAKLWSLTEKIIGEEFVF